MQTAYRKNLSIDEKIADLSKIWMEAKFNFAYFHLVPELDWDAVYINTLSEVQKNKNTLAYYQVLKRFIAKLKDGHTRVQFPKALHNQAYSQALLSSQLIEGNVTVTKGSSEAAAEGINVGDQIISIDGLDVRQYAEEKIKPHVAASTPQDLKARTYTHELFSSEEKSKVKLLIKDFQGKPSKKSLTQANYKKYQSWRRLKTVEFSLSKNNIGWLRLNSFSRNNFYDELNKVLPEIYASDALIIDVRNNGGGNSDQGYHMLQHLTKKTIVGAQWSTRNYKPTYRAWGLSEEVYLGGTMTYKAAINEIYTKPVAVLIGPRTDSAAEDFSVAFDVLDRGPMIGQASGGSTGQSLIFPLPGGGSASVCTKRDRYPDEKEFVGVGVQPNIEIAPTVAAIRAGHDLALLSAVDWAIKNKHEKQL